MDQSARPITLTVKPMFAKNICPKVVTAKIIKALQQGLAPWRIPWTGRENNGFPSDVATGKPFTGVNALLLNLAALEQVWQSKWWSTGMDWTRIGGHVSGKGTQIDGGTVFNAEQAEGLAVHQYRANDRTVPVDWTPAEKIIAACGADIRFQRGNQALYFYPPQDYILFPLKEQFEKGVDGLPAYYGALFS